MAPQHRKTPSEDASDIRDINTKLDYIQSDVTEIKTTFPASFFSNAPTVQLTNVNPTASDQIVPFIQNLPTTTSMMLAVRNNYAGANSNQLSWFAIGT
jgi:hypothetical protein